MGRCDFSPAALEQIQYLLERMLDLAVCAAEEDCGDAQRAELQKGLDFLRGLLDAAAEGCQKGEQTDE